jgi:DNA-binding transcriptional LysR family regulator
MLLRPRLQEIADGLEHAQRDAQRFLTMDEASVTLGIMCTVGPRRFTGLLASFQATQSDVSLQLVEGVPTMLADRLEQNEIDIAIMASPDGFPETLESAPLYREQFLVAFPAGHRFADRSEVPMAEVNGENYLDRVNCEYQHSIDGVMQRCSAPWSPAFRRDPSSNRKYGAKSAWCGRKTASCRRRFGALQLQREITHGFPGIVCTRSNYRGAFAEAANFQAVAKG